jgi:preprotein translocase subunit SecA
MFVSLEDDLVRTYPSLLGRLPTLRRLGPDGPLGRPLGRALVRGAQRTAERRHFKARRELLKMDESLETALAFSGKGE